MAKNIRCNSYNLDRMVSHLHSCEPAQGSFTTESFRLEQEMSGKRRIFSVPQLKCLGCGFSVDTGFNREVIKS